MSWQELSIRVPYEYVEPVSYLFGRYGRGLSMERVRERGRKRDASDLVLMRTYLPANSRQRLARIEVGLKLVAILEPIEDLTITPLPARGEARRGGALCHATVVIIPEILELPQISREFQCIGYCLLGLCY